MPEQRGATCPMCGTTTPIWLDDPPTGCLETFERTLCDRAMTKARAEGTRRKVAPEHFGKDGAILLGDEHFAAVVDAMAKAGLDMWTGLPLRARLEAMAGEEMGDG